MHMIYAATAGYLVVMVYLINLSGHAFDVIGQQFQLVQSHSDLL